MHSKQPKAITLIEILISIAVFSVGILSVSYLIISNIGLSERAKMKTTATMLAKEWIELVYNRRDTNIKKWRLRNCLELDANSYDGTCGYYFHDPADTNGTTKRTIATYFDKWYVFQPAGNLANTKLYKRPSPDGTFSAFTTFSSFGIVGTNSATSFSRTITFTPVYLEPEGKRDHADKILKVTSTVSYKKWTYSGHVSIESFIGNTLDTIPLDYYTN